VLKAQLRGAQAALALGSGPPIRVACREIHAYPPTGWSQAPGPKVLLESRICDGSNARPQHTVNHVKRLSCQAGDDSRAMSLASQALLQNPGNRRAVSLLRRVREVQSPPTPVRRMHLVRGERRRSELRVRRRWSLEVGERACQVGSGAVRGWAGSGTKGRGQQPILLKNVCLET